MFSESTAKTAAINTKQNISFSAIAMLAALFVAALIWSYWTTLTAMAYKWWNDPQYSQGYLVPFFSLVILYLRRDKLEKITTVLDPRGLLLVVLGMLIHVACGFVNQDWIDGISLLIVIAGLFWLFGGWSIMWWALPAILFLIFMIPLPHSVETGLAYPLQRIATIGSLFLIQASGIPAVAEGNVIFLSQSRIGVMEACSGLSMLLIFFALAAAMVVIYRPPLLDTIIIVLSAIPIAIVVNILRITATGIAQEWFGEEAAEKIFHDWAGWLMMPVALGFLALEIWLLRIMVPVQDVSTQKHAGVASIQATRKRLIGRR